MFARVLLTVFLIPSILCGGIAQQTEPSSAPRPATTQKQPTDIDSQDVVRITTNLVQVDAVVTKNGKQVTDLNADDFELLEDGKSQVITNFSYVANVPARIVSTGKSKEKDKTVPVPPAKIDINDQRRTVALVIDDLGISFESMAHIRSELRKFLDQLSPTDLVAIVRTGGDVGSLQQFTNDKRLLESALDHLHWNPCSRVGLYVFPRHGAIGDDPSICSQYVLNGTLKSMQFILKGMAQIPGRKSMVVFSDFLPIEDQESQRFGLNNIRIKEPAQSVSDSDPSLPDSGISYSAQLHRIAELAIRSAVVIYSVDTRGLQTTGLTAADRLTATTEKDKNEEISSILRARSTILLRGREGSDLIAKQTGGFLILNSNDYGLKDIMQDQEGYYLIGFRPAEETFDRKFHHIRVKVKRGGLSLRTRAGFYGFTDEQARPAELSATDLLNKALLSPFGAKDIDVRLTSFFVDDPTDGALLRTFAYFHPRDLTFTEQPDGWRSANVDVKVILFGDNGRIVAQQEHAGSLRYKGASYERAMRDGVTYSFDIRVKMRGVFQFRVAVRDVPTARIGAAGQFVEIPDLRNGRLALSGVVAREEVNATTKEPPDDQRDLASAGPAVRRFRQGSNVDFAFAIYDSNAAGRTSELIQEIRLFRDGKLVFTGPPTAVRFKGQPDPQRITSAARVQLGPALTPGNYVFQVIVMDSSAKQERRIASQWIDFEVIG